MTIHPVAAVDIGSNTVRLLIAVPEIQGGLRFILARLETTRLAAGLDGKGTLDELAVSRSLGILRSYAVLISSRHAAWTVAVGTGALRDSADGDLFAEKLARETGLRLNIVDQDTEALLALMGVESVLGGDADLAAVDIGGRSTEVVLRKAGCQPRIFGLAIGAVGLYEAFIDTDPPDDAALRRLEIGVAEFLDATDLPRTLPEGMYLAGTGGTFTTLAALDQGLKAYDRGRINGCRVTLEKMEKISDLLASMDVKKRSSMPGMEPGRADIIISGAILAVGIVRRLGRREITVSDAGILEGSLLAGLRGKPQLEKSFLQPS